MWRISWSCILTGNEAWVCVTVSEDTAHSRLKYSKVRARTLKVHFVVLGEEMLNEREISD